MTDLLPISIGIGLVVSLLFSEVFGLAAGGMVVPGYIALSLNHPVDLALTLGAALVTFAIVHALASIMIVYGRRRTVLMILVGYLVGAVFRNFISVPAAQIADVDISTIGYIIPGLIAIWMDRQGLAATLSSLLTASVVVRLVLIIFVGTEMQS